MTANGLAEAGGLGTTFVLGTAAAPFLEGSQTLIAVFTVAVVAVLLGTFLEGVELEGDGLRLGFHDNLKRRAAGFDARPDMVVLTLTRRKT